MTTNDKFELWLEGKVNERKTPTDIKDFRKVLNRQEAFEEVLDKYREFKERIQCDDDPQTSELAPEEWVMLECIAEDWKHDSFVYNDTRKAIFEALFNRGFIVKKVWQWHATDQGRAALQKYQDTQHDNG